MLNLVLGVGVFPFFRPIARYGVFGVSTWPIGCNTPSPFSERFPPWRACEVEVRYPPPQKGYLSDTCVIPYENKSNGCDTPLRYYLEQVLRDMVALGRQGEAKEGMPSGTIPYMQLVLGSSFSKCLQLQLQLSEGREWGVRSVVIGLFFCWRAP